jgi:type III secretion protein V
LGFALRNTERKRIFPHRSDLANPHAGLNDGPAAIQLFPDVETPMRYNSLPMPRPRYAIRGDLLIAGLVIMIVALMVLPIRPFLLDTFIAINIGISLLLLLIAAYVPTPLGLSTFPSLLLFTTLLRLSLNIASTRLILLHAHAGQTIETFGNLVVGGNLIVGLVIFTIITIVQFVVVAKGAERVAEVGARFVLDAMPGKQMSIDADLRAGNIDKADAKRRRSLIEQESQLYGAMDGAMKFVKGDAIAGLLIAIVNLVAGVTIGVLMMGMPVIEAISTYSLLTVGDGLVSQIPSLFVTIAAAVLITRVSNTEEKRSEELSQLVGKQLFSQPKALVIAGVVLLGLALIPGLPVIQFAMCGFMLGTAGITLLRRERRLPAAEAATFPSLQREGLKSQEYALDISEDNAFIVTAPLELRLSRTCLSRSEIAELEQACTRVRQSLHSKTGIPFPGVQVRLDDNLPPLEFLILLNDIPVIRAHCLPATSAVNRAKLVTDSIDSAAITSDQVSSSANNEHHQKIALPPALTPQGNTGTAQHIAAVLERVLMQNMSEFIGIQEVQYILAEAEKHYPDLVAETQRAIQIGRLTDVLRRLTNDGVSLRNIRVILQALAEWSSREKDPVLLTEHVRIALGKIITYQFVGEARRAHVVSLSPDTEERVRSCIRQTAGGSFLALPPDEAQQLRASIVQAFTNTNQRFPTLMLVSMDVRRYVSRLLEDQSEPRIPVLSYQEIDTRLIVESRKTVSIRP